MGSEDDRWVNEEAGPVSRPYTVTGGRTRPRGTRYLDLADLIVRGARQADTTSVSPEFRRILDLCRLPVSVAELAAIIGLPLGVIRVLLDDLLRENLIEVMEAPRGRVTDQRLLAKVLEGLRALLAACRSRDRPSLSGSIARSIRFGYSSSSSQSSAAAAVQDWLRLPSGAPVIGW